MDPTGRRRIWGRKRVVYEGADRQSSPDQRPKKTRCYFRMRWEEWVESRILSLLPLPRKYSFQWGRAGLLVSLESVYLLSVFFFLLAKWDWTKVHVYYQVNVIVSFTQLLF